MLKKADSKEEFVEVLMSLWYKCPAKKCLNCGMPFIAGAEDFCCTEPFIGTNSDELEMFATYNEQRRANQLNVFGSNKKKTFRSVMTLPTSLMKFLDKEHAKATSTKHTPGEKLFKDDKDLVWFTKRFGKYFQVAEVI